MTQLYEFTNGTKTFMINIEHIMTIARMSDGAVIITMLDGSSHSIKMDYEHLKKFLKKQSAVFITETVNKTCADVPL